MIEEIGKTVLVSGSTVMGAQSFTGDLFSTLIRPTN